ncbi:MAG: fumarylacetoacetate hydrolase family protein [Bacteroidetes bacterium]|nr:MAG: fumarylacetoacetate hydrolase family protein [Bacteroidota bacterium]
MKLVTYLANNKPDLGILIASSVYSLHQLDASLPDNMRTFLFGGKQSMDKAMALDAALKNGNLSAPSVSIDGLTLLAPVNEPTSCRDGYAFRQHVAAARRNRGVPMIPEFDQYPIFYFTNHNAIQGPGVIDCMPDHFEKLDFELEVAIVVGKKGRNIKAAEADEYIAGYMIMNDMSARTLQMEEMLLNLGPAKGKDFSTVIGPYFVTPDELAPYLVPAKPNHVGNNHNLSMKCWVNGVLVSEGNVADMDWTFAEILERCAYGVDLFPGDVIGSGTVGTGCFLELNGTGLLNDKNFKPQWLQDGDVVEMEITGLGRLSNTIKRVESNFSLLKLKKVAAAE